MLSGIMTMYCNLRKGVALYGKKDSIDGKRVLWNVC